MKKILILSILLLVLTSLSVNAYEYDCGNEGQGIDPETTFSCGSGLWGASKDYYKQGRVVMKKYNDGQSVPISTNYYSDTCVNINTLREYSCGTNNCRYATADPLGPLLQQDYTCPLDNECSLGKCTPCIEETCENKGWECGSFSNTCGGQTSGTVDCGECTGSDTCENGVCTTCIPTTEICDNLADDDCDGLIDSNDPDCPEIVCTPTGFIPVPEQTYLINTCDSGTGNHGTASSICASLCTDCKLPNINQLETIYNNKDTIGGFTTGSYWSSTTAENNYAWYIAFSNGFINKINRISAYPKFRCIKDCISTETPETTCDDGIDNDCDGSIDSADPDCVATAVNCSQPCNQFSTQPLCEDPSCDGECIWDIMLHNCLPSGDQACGNNIKGYSEGCDGSDFGEKTCDPGLVPVCNEYCEFSCENAECAGKTCADYTPEQCNINELCSIYGGCYLDINDFCSECDQTMTSCEMYDNSITCEFNPCEEVYPMPQRCKWDNNNCIENTNILIGYVDILTNKSISCSWNCLGTSWSECIEGIKEREGNCDLITGGTDCETYATPSSRRSCIIAKEFSFFSEKSILVMFILLISYYFYTSYFNKHKSDKKRYKKK